MPRSYARVTTQLWRDEEFCALSPRAQWSYLLLITQSDISAAGVLALRLRRWSSLACGMEVPHLESAIDELAKSKFVAVDYETEELLVRSFVRWDGGHTNSKRRPVIRESALELNSPRLRAVLAHELDRLDFHVDGLSDRASDTAFREGEPEAGNDASTGYVTSVTKNASAQVDRPSDSASDTTSPSERVVVGYVSTGGTATHNPQPTNPPPVGAVGAQQIVGRWIDSCRKRPPSNVIGQISKHVKSMLNEGIDDADVLAGLQEWARKGNLHPSTLPSLVNEVMNRPAQQARKATSKEERIAALDRFRDEEPDAKLWALPVGGVA